MPPAFHVIFVSLLTGLFFFAVLATVVRYLLSLRGADENSRLAVATDLGALWAAAIGTVFVVFAVVFGFTIWVPSAAINSPVIRNKVLTSVLLLATVIIYLVIRMRAGSGMWRNRWLGLFQVLVAFAAFHWAMVTNSIGGEVAGIPSGYETIVRLSGVETRVTYYLPTWALGVVVLLTIAMIVIAFTDSSDTSDTAEEPVAVET